ncbi:MAG: M1 family peptidase [Rhizobiales bacterium]|nr:M1 family peptidase [Hyphomicrobiales bacterium]
MPGQISLSFDLATWMQVDDIRLNGVAINSRQSGRTHTLTLPGRETQTIELRTSGKIPALDLKNLKHRGGTAPVAGEESVYLPGWSGWIAKLKGFKSDYQLTVTSHAPYRATATGALKSERLGEAQNSSVFRSELSLEPPSVFAGPYEVDELRSGNLRIRSYFHKEASQLAEDYLQAAKRHIQNYARQIGPYPFADFVMVSAPLPVGLGFPNLTYVDRRILRLPFMKGRSLAHEILHNWWGNGVYADYASGNWSEGLTTYLADHALAVQRSPDRGREMRLAWLRDYAALSPLLDQPVTRFVSKEHDASQIIGYGKVAYIFHMLKHEIGEAPFARALKDFWTKHKFQTATWHDIQTAFETTSARSLDWFFDQWVHKAGAPSLTIDSVSASSSGTEHEISFRLVQKGPVYRLKVPIVVTTKTGTQHFEIALQKADQSVVLQTNGQPTHLTIDPEHEIFRRLLPGEAPPIARDVLLDPNAKSTVLYDQPQMEEKAHTLSARLFQRSPDALQGNAKRHLSAAPLLVLGSRNQIDAFLKSQLLPSRPPEITEIGEARAWTVRAASGKAIMFVEADTPEAFPPMLRYLPHYRSKSYVLFQNGRAARYGVWALSDGPLATALQPRDLR